MRSKYDCSQNCYISVFFQKCHPFFFSGNLVFTEFEVLGNFSETSLHVATQANDTCPYSIDFVIDGYEVQHVGLTAHAHDNLGFPFTHLSWPIFSR